MYVAPLTRLNLMWPSWPGAARVTGGWGASEVCTEVF